MLKTNSQQCHLSVVRFYTIFMFILPRAQPYATFIVFIFHAPPDVAVSVSPLLGTFLIFIIYKGRSSMSVVHSNKPEIIWINVDPET